MVPRLPRNVRKVLDEVEQRARAVDSRADVVAALVERTERLMGSERDLEERQRHFEAREQRLQRDLEGRERHIEELVARIERARDELSMLRDEYAEHLARPDTIPDLVRTFWYEKERLVAELHEFDLKQKRHPALKAAEQVAAVRRELAEEKARRKQVEFELAVYEYDFPWLTEYREIDVEDGVDATNEAATGEDPALSYVSDSEYRAVPEVERNQLTLDRYVASRKKSKWQIGRDYEMYVGYLWTQRGARVTYRGILERFEDLGRDVIAETDTTVEIIQCKFWSQKKVLRENHIFQLAGTVLAARQEEQSSSGLFGGRVVTRHFFTSTFLSTVAEAFARKLDIKVSQQQPMEGYPRIKCNVSRATSECIYHLPFDQQYDTTVIEPERGEFFAWTTEHAERAGFRRAWRWSPSESATDPER